MAQKRWALLSVTDKTGLVEFARALVRLHFELLSSGGTARTLQAAGIPVTEVAHHTGSPEILGGRVKTLHPRIHGGILARNRPEDLRELEQRDIPPIDLVVVNLYRFEEALLTFRPEAPAPDALERPEVERLIEEIDIGGPTLLRAAAKSAARVGVVVDPADYDRVARALSSPQTWTLELRTELAARAFRRVAEYDRAIERFFTQLVAVPRQAETPESPPGAALAGAEQLLDGDLPPALEQALGKDPESCGVEILRYGENPHQRGLALRGRFPGEASVLHARLLSGKQLSYNNLLDAESALNLVKEFSSPAVVIVKHAKPCGAALAESVEEAFLRAHSGDPLSAFGGIVAFNRPLEAAVARRIAVKEHFFEVLVAPEVTAEALEILQRGAAWGNSLRVLACGDPARRDPDRPRWSIRSLVGGVLVQQRDLADTYQPRVVTRRSPDSREEADLRFAWTVVKHVHSNAIVLVRDRCLVGTGAGQMSRVDSVEIAVKKAGPRAAGTCLASDAFFPFRDGVDAALRAGVQAIAQPGGSRRDQEVITACDESGAAMVFTGHRHFKH